MATEIMNNSESNSIESINQESIHTETLSIYKGMNEVFAHTKKIINDMGQGERITVKDLTDKVHTQMMDMASGNVLNLVQLFLKQSKEVTVENGRGGGVFKGGKPKRIDNRPRCLTCNQVVRPDASKTVSGGEAVQHAE